MYNNSELTANYRNDYSNNFADLQSDISASVVQNYQSEIQLIDNDQSLSTKDKIKLRRNSLLFLSAAAVAIYFTPQICKHIENRIPA